jgi:DNA-binding NarL/FixJ family response regulator
VVDDQAAFRDAAREVIDATPGFACAGQATSGEEAVVAAERDHPDLVLLDVRMPGIGGARAAGAIAQQQSPPIVVLISGDDLPELERDPGRVGAAGFVRKERFGPRMLRELWQRYGPGRGGEE